MNVNYSSATGQALTWCAIVVACVAISAMGALAGYPGETITTLICVIGLGDITWVICLCRQTDRQFRRIAMDVSVIMFGTDADLDALLDDPTRSWFPDLAASKRYKLAQGIAYSDETELAPYEARLDRSAMLLSAATRVLPAAGLIGTVLGMSIAMQSISEGMADTSDPVAVITSLQSTLQGMSTAFNTTLIACFAGGLILAPLVAVFRSHSRALIGKLRRDLALLQFPHSSPNAHTNPENDNDYDA